MSDNTLSRYPVLLRLRAGELDDVMPERSRARALVAIEAALRSAAEQDRKDLLAVISSQVHGELSNARQSKELDELRQVVKGTRPGYTEAQVFATQVRGGMSALRYRLNEARTQLAQASPDNPALGVLFGLEHDVSGALISLNLSVQKLHEAFSAIEPDGTSTE